MKFWGWSLFAKRTICRNDCSWCREGFNLMVPVRRMIRWAEKNDIMWAIDPKVEMPPMEEILSMQIEDTGVIRKMMMMTRMNYQLSLHFHIELKQSINLTINY